MGDQLPLFEGFQPSNQEIRLTGAISTRHEEPLHIGQQAYFLVRGRTVGVNHERKRNGALLRSHKVEIVGAERVDAEAIVNERLIAEASEYLMALEAPEDGEDDAT